jgi:hypothetical protein
MSFSTLQRLVHALAVLVALAVLAGWALTVSGVRAAMAPGAVTPVATALLVVPAGVVLLFLLSQSVPGGRRIVPLGLTRSPDAWLLIFVITTLAPKERLASWAIATVRAAETGVPISLVIVVLAIAARVYQLNRGAALGATPGEGARPG